MADIVRRGAVYTMYVYTYTLTEFEGSVQEASVCTRAVPLLLGMQTVASRVNHSTSSINRRLVGYH